MPSISSSYTPTNDEDTNNVGSTSSTTNTNSTLTPPSTGSSGGGSITPVGGAGSPSASPGAAKTPGTTSQPTSSGSYNNIQKYLNANQNFNQNQGGLAGQINQNISGSVNQANNNLQSAGNAFNSQAGTAANAFDNTTSNNNLLNAFQNNTASTAANNQDVQQATQLANASYNGPNGLENLQGNQNLNSLQLQGQELSNLAGQTQSENGRFNLLRQMFGNSNYTQGDQTLDNIMLQNTPGQMNALQNVNRQVNQYNQNLTNTENTANQTAQNYQNQASQVAAQTQGAINQAIQNYIPSMQQEYKNDLSTQTTDMNQFASDFASGNLSPSDVALLQAGGYNVTPGQAWVNPGTFSPTSLQGLVNATPITAQQAATAQDYSTLQALNGILGGNNSTVGTLANTANQTALAGYLPYASQAGTIPTTPFSINAQGLGTLESQAMGNYNTAIAPLQSALSSVTAPSMSQSTYTQLMNPTSALGQTPLGKWMQSGTGGNDADALAATVNQLQGDINQTNQNFGYTTLGTTNNPVTPGTINPLAPRMGTPKLTQMLGS